jgi:IS605 OrfB family transposase
LHKEVIDLTELQKKSKNKVHFELYEINHKILKMCKTWHVAKIAVEDLKFKKSDKFWSKDLNRLCRSQFRYSFVKQHLQTLCNVYGVELIEVNAAYSSIIGNFIHGSDHCPDMVAASIEIARRAYHKFQKGWIYPSYNIK